MQIRVLFDSRFLQKRFCTGWGVSFLVNGDILFDGGEKAEPLLKNMESMGAEISDIKNVVVSHDHWDHTGGLWELLKRNSGVKVYVCPGFSRNFKSKVRSLGGKLAEAAAALRISDGIYTTGEIAGEYNGRFMPEQSLVLKVSKGLIVITGCAHPGITNITKKAKEQFPGECVYMVFGGFHLMDEGEVLIESVVKELRSLGVKKVGPTHCSGKTAERIFRFFSILC